MKQNHNLCRLIIGSVFTIVILIMKRKVLIIDDEVDFCLLMKYYLSKKDCDVSISHTLTEGIGMVAKKHPDVIILDNNLPDGFGWAEAQNILRNSPDANLFLISANKSNLQYELMNDHFHVVEKPISIKQIDNFLK